MNLAANPPFNDSDTALRACAFLQSEATMKVVSEAKDNTLDPANDARLFDGETELSLVA